MNKPTVRLPVSQKLTPAGGMRLAAPKLTLADVAQAVKKVKKPKVAKTVKSAVTPNPWASQT
jgi:hypothetical protein